MEVQLEEIFAAKRQPESDWSEEGLAEQVQTEENFLEKDRTIFRKKNNLELGGDSCSVGCGFESQDHILDGLFHIYWLLSL